MSLVYSVEKKDMKRKHKLSKKGSEVTVYVLYLDVEYLGKVLSMCTK